MPVLAYRSPSPPTVVRQTASRWLKNAARATATAALVSFIAHAILTWRAAPAPWAFLHDLVATDFLLSLPAVGLACTAAALTALAKPVLHANPAACYTASALVMLLQLFSLLLSFVGVGGCTFFLTTFRPIYLLYLPLAGIALFALALFSDLNHLLQWIPRYPNGETTLNRFLPRLPFD